MSEKSGNFAGTPESAQTIGITPLENRTYAPSGGSRPRLLDGCDYICNCPANNTAERVESTLLAKLYAEVEGLGRVDTQIKSGHLIVAHPQGALLFRDEVLSLLKKAGA